MNIDKKTEYDVKVSGVEISPNPVARGQPATFSIAATTGTTNSASSTSGSLFLCWLPMIPPTLAVMLKIC